jgi:hypothetical protein
MYNLWPCPSTLLIRSITVARVNVKSCVAHCQSSPKYTFMSRSVSSQITQFENFDVKKSVCFQNELLENNSLSLKRTVIPDAQLYCNILCNYYSFQIHLAFSTVCLIFINLFPVVRKVQKAKNV